MLRDDLFKFEILVAQIGVGYDSRKRSKATDKAPDLKGSDGLKLLRLLDHVAEEIGDLDLAVVSFERASELAESTGQTDLQAISRLRLAGVLERVGTTPQQ